MKTKFLFPICFCAFFSVHSAHARWPQVDPHAENHYPQTPYSFAGNNPVRHVDPDGRDYYRSENGTVIWQDDHARKLTIQDEPYKNIGTSYSQQMADGSYANFYQGVLISTSDTAVDAAQTVRNDPKLTGMLLSGDSPLSGKSQEGLMTELVHHAQGDFLSGTVDFTGTALESTGNGIAAAGYVVSASGVGAGVGTAISGVGNGMARIGTGMKTLANIAEGNYGQAIVTSTGYLMNKGTGMVAKYGASGREAIEGGVNAFFTPMNTLIGNIKYRQQ